MDIKLHWYCEGDGNLIISDLLVLGDESKLAQV